MAGNEKVERESINSKFKTSLANKCSIKSKKSKHDRLYFYQLGKIFVPY
jgi:hypothetical protein